MKCNQRPERITADIKINNTKTIIPPNDPIKEPEILSQKELNCWQMANQLARVFPLCAKNTIAVAADAAAVKSANIPFKKTSISTCSIETYIVKKERP